MTVSSIGSVAEFATNGVTTNFPFFFKFLDNEDLVVTYVDALGAVLLLTYGTDYTVNGAGSEAGGSVVTSSARPTGQLIVSREMAPLQGTSLRNQGKFLAETHEDVFDKLTMLIQQGFSLASRALRRPFGKNYYDAEGRNISNLADPLSGQDAATMSWAARYFGDLIDGASGNINTTTGILYDSGTLFDHLRFGVARNVDSIAALRQLSSARNQRAFAVGYNAKGDGGGGPYYIDPADTTSLDNGGTVIVAADGARWKLAHNGVVSLRQFGAGLSAGVACDAQILAAFNSVDSFGSPELYAAAGTYRMTTGITCSNKPITLRGAGMGKTIFSFEGSGTTFAMRFLPGDVLRPMRLEDFTIRPANASASSGRPLAVEYPTTASWSGKTLTIKNIDAQSDLSGAAFNYWTSGFYFSNCWNARGENLYFTGKANDWVATVSAYEFGENCTDASFTRLHGFFVADAVLYTGYSEGITVADSVFVLVFRGFRNTTSTLLNVRAHGNHVNATGACFVLTGSSQNQINDNLLYVTNAAGTVVGSFNNCNDGNYHDNICFATAGSVDGFSFAGTSQGNLVDNNRFAGTVSGVVLNATTSLNYVGNKNIRTVAGVRQVGVLDLSTSNVVTKNSADFTVIKAVTGGAVNETLTIALPANFFKAKPASAIIALNGGNAIPPMLCYYDFDNASNSATQIMVRVFTPTGVNLVGGSYRFSVRASE